MVAQTSNRNFLNRKRWAIDQQKQARAKFSAEFPANDAAQDIEKLNQLRTLAGMLADKPYMASTLDAVNAEIARLASHYKV